MPNELKGQVAIVTGAASGLGLSIARALSNEGVKLALLDKDIDALEKLTGSFSFEGRRCDITSEADVAKNVREIAGFFGRIDILVNSAGITGKTNIKSHETDSADIRQVFDINFMGSYFTA